MATFTESIVEQAALEWLTELGYEYQFGAKLSRINTLKSAEDFKQAILENELIYALVKLNPNVIEDSINEAYRKALYSAKSRF